jgi:hypothetical protein
VKDGTQAASGAGQPSPQLLLLGLLASLAVLTFGRNLPGMLALRFLLGLIAFALVFVRREAVAARPRNVLVSAAVGGALLACMADLPGPGLQASVRLLSLLGDASLLAGTLLMLVLVYARWDSRAPSQNACLWGLGTALACVLVWSLYLLEAWPGRMSDDSLSQWHQALTLRLDDHFPPLHTLLFRFLGVRFGGPQGLAIVQLLVLAAACGAAVAELVRWRADWRLVGFSAGLWVLLPIHGIYASTLWKDVLYGAACLVLAVVVLARVRRAGDLGWPDDFAFVAALLLPSVLRHNGPAVSCAALLVAWLAGADQRRRVLRCAVVFALGMVVLTVAVPKALGVHSQAADFVRIQATHEVAAILASGRAPIAEGDLTLIESLAQRSEWLGRYSCYQTDELYYSDGFNRARLAEVWPRFRALWSRWVAACPGVLFRHQRCLSSIIWRISSPRDGYLYAFHEGISPNKFGLASHSAAPWLSSPIRRIEQWTLEASWFFWRPATALAVTLIALWLAGSRHPNLIPLWLGMMVLAQSVPLLLTVPVQDVRYQYPVFLWEPLALGWLGVLPRRPATLRESDV